jgi:hypothetical protein
MCQRFRPDAESILERPVPIIRKFLSHQLIAQDLFSPAFSYAMVATTWRGMNEAPQDASELITSFQRGVTYPRHRRVGYD